MTEPVKPPASAAAKRAGENAALSSLLNEVKALSLKLDHLHNLHADLHSSVVAGNAAVTELHSKLDTLTARADEAEKLLNSPAAKAAKAVQKVWKGL